MTANFDSKILPPTAAGLAAPADPAASESPASELELGLRALAGGGQAGSAVERLSKLQRVAREILTGEDPDSGALGFMARLLVQCTMPHRDPKCGTFKRKNGSLTLSMNNDPEIGLPYGRYPRLLLAWVTTEAVRSQARELELGASLSQFMRKLGLKPTGGRHGTVGRLRNQMRRLFTSTVSVSWDETTGPIHGFEEAGFRVADALKLWWRPSDPDQQALWGSTVVLSESFFQAITTRPVPVDLRAFRVLRSPLALDLYVWLGYRLFVLNESSRPKAQIPWDVLQLQFGSDYKRPRAFRENALKALGQVLEFYPDAQLSSDERGLLLLPSKLPMVGEKGR